MTRRFVGKYLLVATHNAGKLEEIAALLSAYDVTLTSNAAFGLPEPEESADSFVGNARIKAQAGARATGLPALSDDSGVMIDALNGAPGVRTADWAETGQGRDFGVAMDRVWEELQMSGAPGPYRAKFCCALVLAWPDGHDESFVGVMPGQIIWPGRGDQGHGYDPIFQPDGHERTFAEMDRWQKNKISHRAIAFEKLVAGCFG